MADLSAQDSSRQPLAPNQRTPQAYLYVDHCWIEQFNARKINDAKKCGDATVKDLEENKESRSAVDNQTVLAWKEEYGKNLQKLEDHLKSTTGRCQELSTAYCQSRIAYGLPVMERPIFHINILNCLEYHTIQREFEVERAARHLSSEILPFEVVQQHLLLPELCFTSNCPHMSHEISRESELAAYKALIGRNDLSYTTILTRDIARMTGRNTNGTRKQQLQVSQPPPASSFTNNTTTSNNSIIANKLTAVLNSTTSGERTTSTMPVSKGANDNVTGSENAPSKNKGSTPLERLDALPNKVFPPTDNDPFYNHMEKSKDTQSKTATLSPAQPPLEGPEPSQHEVDDGLCDALTEIAIQQSLDEMRPEDLLALAQTSVGALGRPKQQFSHNVEDAEETERLLEEDLDMEDFENEDEDDDEVMGDAEAAQDGPKSPTSHSTEHAGDNENESDSDSEDEPEKRKKSSRGAAPFSGCLQSDSDSDDNDDDQTGGAGATRMGSHVNNNQIGARQTRSSTKTKASESSKPKSKSTTSKGVKSGRVTKLKPKNKKSTNTPENPFAPNGFPLMTYAGDSPSGIKSDLAWKKHYRSADCSIYRSPEVGEWREKANALRKAGLTRRLALQRWKNKLDTTSRTKAQRETKEAADEAALGDVKDWLAGLSGEFKWDEQQQRRVRKPTGKKAKKEFVEEPAEEEFEEEQGEDEEKDETLTWRVLD